jgi:hypothetical protein
MRARRRRFFVIVQGLVERWSENAVGCSNGDVTAKFGGCGYFRRTRHLVLLLQLKRAKNVSIERRDDSARNWWKGSLRAQQGEEALFEVRKCPHSTRKYTCVVCCPQKACEHNRVRWICTICKANGMFYEHRRGR